jgi:hypothetical protein
MNTQECCNQNCNQGRDCPLRNTKDESFDRTASHMAGEYVSHRSLAEEITEGFEALKRIRELEAECDRLYRIIELNGTLK